MVVALDIPTDLQLKLLTMQILNDFVSKGSIHVNENGIFAIDSNDKCAIEQCLLSALKPQPSASKANKVTEISKLLQ